MDDTERLRTQLAEATRGEYELLHQLGQGGMATVYLAHDLALDRRVAIKVMAPHLVAVEGMAERFLQEARVAAALSHPSIVPIHAVRRSGELLFFVMRYVAGRSLDAVLAERGALSVPMVRAILTQVGAALEAAHRKGVIHRDIKPANILLDDHGDALVADFGIARVSAKQGTTQVGQTVGTPEYMSAEQCAGWALTGAADQYSLGVVAYELLAGAPPYRGESLLQVVWKMMNEPAMPIIVHRRDVPEALSEVIERMMSRDAEQRFASVADAVAALPPLTLGPDDPVRRELIECAQPPKRAASRASAATMVVTPAPATAPTAPTAETAHAARPVAALRLPLAAGVMTIDDITWLSPEAVDAAGLVVEGTDIRWESSDAAVARVTYDGRVIAASTGRATITAHAGDAMCSVIIVVTRAGLRSFELTPKQAVLEVGDRVPLEIATGEARTVMPHPRLADWSSSDSAVARVDCRGRVTAVGEGQATITARAGGATSTVTFRVTKAMITAVRVSGPLQRVTVGAPVRLAAEPANTKGHPLPGMAVTWEVSDPAVAAISADGLLVPLRSGQVLVAARVAGRVGTTRVTIQAPALAG